MVEVESCMSRSAGHCMTMGTASTMASMVEALGMGLPTNAAIPAVDSRRKVLARLAGRRIVEMVHEDLRMSKILTKEAFENAIMVNGAIGGSTNAVVHLLAIAGRIGVKLSLDDWDRLGRDMPCLVNLMPSGKYLMEDFYYAGGLPVVIREIGELAAQEGADRQRQDDLGQQQGRRQLQRGGDHAAREAVQAAGRHRGAARQPRARRRRAEALGGDAEADEAQGPRRRVRGHRRPARAHRRPEARRRRVVRAGAQELRAEGLSGLSGGRQFRAAGEDAEAGRHRHGPHLRRADVGHRLRHGRAAHGAGSRGRRAAGAGRERRPDRARRREAADPPARRPTRSSRGAARHGSRRRRTPTAAG